MYTYLVGDLWAESRVKLTEEDALYTTRHAHDNPVNASIENLTANVNISRSTRFKKSSVEAYYAPLVALPA